LISPMSASVKNSVKVAWVPPSSITCWKSYGCSTVKNANLTFSNSSPGRSDQRPATGSLTRAPASRHPEGLARSCLGTSSICGARTLPSVTLAEGSALVPPRRWKLLLLRPSTVWARAMISDPRQAGRSRLRPKQEDTSQRFPSRWPGESAWDTPFAN
jgi:hypothetical protein